MNKFKLCFLVFILTGILISCEKSDDGSSEIKIIEISTSSFNGGYPAVWFNSTSCIIQPVGAEPDESYSHTSDYKFWIEPNDPEFTYLDRDNIGNNGIKLIGSGDNSFNSTIMNAQMEEFSYNIQENDFVVSNVFYIRAPKGDCVIQITEFNQTDSVLKFKWKSL